MYSNCAPLASYLRKNPKKLHLPRQGSLGNCWLLAAAVGLESMFPGLLLGMICLGETAALVKFPRRKAVSVSYMLPEAVTVRLSQPEDLYWAILCSAVCQVLYDEGGSRFTYKRLRYGLQNYPGALFSDAHGGLVSEALRIMSPVPPGVASLVQGTCPRDGLLFAEVLRGDGWHSMFVFELFDTMYTAYDPWGSIVSMPRHSGDLRFYPIMGGASDPPQPLLTRFAPLDE